MIKRYELGGLHEITGMEDDIDGGWVKYADHVAEVQRIILTRPLAARPEGNAIVEIAAERRRQVEKEGYDSAHDDEHDNGELALAAACYAMDGVGLGNPEGAKYWPWGSGEFKSRDHRSNLIRAGALIVAEIERLDRPCLPSPQKTRPGCTSYQPGADTDYCLRCGETRTSHQL